MKLSIITINYNNKAGLEKTVASVMAQTWRSFEWIIIDGGSTDGSAEVIAELANNPEANISYWCSEKDKGVYNAMNKGIAHAKGEYLNFMNSGDCFIDSNSLSKVFCQNHDADVLYGLMLRPDGSINNKRNMKKVLHWYDFYFDALGHQASFTKRSVFDRFGLFDENYKILSDWHYWAKVIVWGGASYKFLPFKIALYEGGGISDSPAMLEEVLKIRKEFYPEMMMGQVLPVVERKNLIERYWFTRFVTQCMYRVARFYHNRFDKDYNVFI